MDPKNSSIRIRSRPRKSSFNTSKVVTYPTQFVGYVTITPTNVDVTPKTKVYSG